MRITELPIAVLRFQYQLVRTPLELIEDRVVSRMGAEAPARLFYERSLGVLDATVGSALGDPRLERRGSALVDRSDALSRAAQLEETATQKKAKADAELAASREKVIEDRDQAHEAKKQGVEEARAEAEQRKRAAAEEARERTAATKRQVDEVAARRTNAAEEIKRNEQAKIRAAEQKVTAAADSKLKDAQAKRDEAESKRAQANRVEQLADVEKQNRQAKRAAKP
ncbi:IF2 family translation initiation factor [Mycolicibacterium sp. 624]|uniref:IF2 family translation initiation factor n=1 Tax=Mycolicibacterium sp. 624 TaxID=3156314 RepID=UPI003396F51D